MRQRDNKLSILLRKPLVPPHRKVMMFVRQLAWEKDMKQRRRPVGDAPRVAVGKQQGRAGPLDVKFEFVVVDGEAARHLAPRQGQAIRNLLAWIAENPDLDHVEKTKP